MDYRAANEGTRELRTAFTSKTGGVLTRETGAITGELEISTRAEEDERFTVSVRYVGADEWYTVPGSPVRIAATPEVELRDTHQALHQRILEQLRRPGPVRDGNEQPVDISDLEADTEATFDE